MGRENVSYKYAFYLFKYAIQQEGRLTNSSNKVVKVFLNLCLKWSAFERVFFLFLAKWDGIIPTHCILILTFSAIMKGG